MTLISMSAGRVIMRDGKIATEQECCCCPCFFQHDNLWSFCPNLDDPAVTPEFIAAECARLAACWATLAEQFEAAGYTVTTTNYDPGCASGCGETISIHCPSCAQEWVDCIDFENPSPCTFDERFAPLPDFGFCFSTVSSAGWTQRCVNGDPGNTQSGGVLTLQGNDGVYYIPLCGNPLP